jgi:hypothetical protein
MITIISTIRADHTHGDGCGGAAAWVFRPVYDKAHLARHLGLVTSVKLRIMRPEKRDDEALIKYDFALQFRPRGRALADVWTASKAMGYTNKQGRAPYSASCLKSMVEGGAAAAPPQRANRAHAGQRNPADAPRPVRLHGRLCQGTDRHRLCDRVKRRELITLIGGHRAAHSGRRWRVEPRGLYLRPGSQRLCRVARRERTVKFCSQAIAKHPSRSRFRTPLTDYRCNHREPQTAE